jgi:hypothetical protein
MNNEEPESGRGKRAIAASFRLACPVLLCALCVSAVNADDKPPPGWQVVAPKNAGFSIFMPGRPQTQKRNVPTKAGNSELVTYVVPTRLGTFNLGYSESKQAANVKPEKLFDDFRDQMVKQFQGTVKEEKTFDLDSHPGREILLETAKRGYVRERFILVDDRLYTISVTGAREWVTGPEANRFFESFKLVEKP